MYSYEDRIRAVALYLELGKRTVATIRQLGYPTKNALKGWHREYEQGHDLQVGYLYEEPLKRRILNKTEQNWANTYPRLKPEFEKYEHHLRQAAIGGLRQAAAEFADVFDSVEFFALAEQGAGPIDARRMAKIARTRESQYRWLPVISADSLASDFAHKGRAIATAGLRVGIESGY